MKYCGQCGAQNPDEAKFCGNCGATWPEPAAPAPEPAPEPVPASEPQATQSAQAAQTPSGAAQPQTPQVTVPPQAKAFFGWVWSCFRAPSQQYGAQSWWPFAAMGLLSFVMALILHVSASKAVAASMGYGSSILSSYGISYAPSVSVPITFLIKSWLFMALFVYALIGIAYLGYLIKGDKTPFVVVHVRMAQYFMPALGAMVVALLLSFLGLAFIGFSSTIFMGTCICMMALPGVMYAQATSVRNVDSAWLWIAATVLGGIVLSILCMLISNMVAADLNQSLSGLFSGISSTL